MNTRESKIQELAGRLVEREVIYCVSSLVSTLSELTQECPNSDLSWEDDILPLLEGYDFEEAATQTINDADWDALEIYADQLGYWSDVLYQIGAQDVEDLEEWLDSRDDARDLLGKARAAVRDMCTDPETFCRECDDIDMDDFRFDVYEHWIVSRSFLRKLKKAGEVVGELCGMSIWGRATTGQAISMDGVIRRIAIELWGDELEGLE